MVNATLRAYGPDLVPLPTAPYMERARRASKVVADCLDTFGKEPVTAYLHSILDDSQSNSTDRSTLLDAISSYVTRLLGADIAAQTCRDLGELPAALTTNHHGVDTFAQSVQGTLLLSRRQNRWGGRFQTVPIFACGAVPLDNLTYPMGLLLYRPADDALEHHPRKLPLFSNKHRRELVSVAPPITQDVVLRTRQRLGKMILQGEVDAKTGESIDCLLESDYLHDSVLNLENYSDQAVVLNHRLWKRLITAPSEQPDIVYLELERLTSMILTVSLADPATLTQQVMFNDTLRSSTLKHLEGAVGCWQLDLLERRANESGCTATSASTGIGTVFFWGVGAKNRRVPMLLKDGILQGVDDKGQQLSVRFTPQDVCMSLAAGQLLPSLFTCFLAVAFEQGVNCLGGYHQAVYLPDMQTRLLAALACSSDFDEFSRAVFEQQTSNYLSGMQAVVSKLDNGGLIPAGVGEICSSGGLTADDLARVDATNVHDTHVASLLETVSELTSGDQLQPTWKNLLALECGHELQDRLVTC